MEKRRIFSIKFLVFSFALSFSVIFLILFSIWLIKATPSSHLRAHNLPSNAIGIFDNKSSKAVLGNSIPAAADEDGSSFGGAREKESESTAVTGDGDDDSLFLSGNLSSIASSDGAVVSFFSKSAVDDITESGESVNIESADEEELQELDDVLETGDVSGEEQNVELATVRDSDMDGSVSFDRQHMLSRQKIETSGKVMCDITKGKWVLDENYPLYTNWTCPFIDEGFNCLANGRADKGYMKWRWQPQDCYIPRFNATKMLELIRGKRVVFVGDSLNRNQWESMLCMLMGAIKDRKKVFETRGRKITKGKGNYCFMFEDYKCRVEFYVSHFLVRESKARIGKKRAQTLQIDRIDKASSRWRGAHILVFNTGHWWSHQKTKAGINYYQEGDQVHPRLHVNKAFYRALSTWASWVDSNVNPRKTRIFFTSFAPSHFRGGSWNAGGHCKEAFQPLNHTAQYSEKNLIVEEIIRQMKNAVTFLNITGLSDFRPDGHPSIYGRKFSNGVQDCSHWCLPGVPDNWNELLYYHLQSRTKIV